MRVRIQDIIRLIEAEVVVTGEEKEIHSVFAGDRISDLIHNSGENTLLVTHLNHISLAQLYKIFDVPAICLVPDLTPIPELIDSAMEKNAYLIVSPLEMYETCGRIYKILSNGTKE